TDTLNLRTSQYRKVRDKLKNSDKLPNNTFFKSYVRYRRNIDDLRSEFIERFAGDISQYLVYLQEKYD
ncbi:MAG: aminopeptidase, partial [Tunicatimonas sp.]